MKELSRSNRKKLNSLIGKGHGYWGEKSARDYYNEIKDSKPESIYGNIRKRIRDILEAHKIFNDHFFTEGDRAAYWRDIISQRQSRRYFYNSMPARPRKDNKDYINYGSGSGNSSWLRYPKKVRKTAWKRFLKLFPFAKDKR